MNNINTVDAKMNSLQNMSKETSTTTTKSNQNLKLFDFIKTKYTEKGSTLPSTNTRIKDEKLNIFGGNYHIPEDEYPQFLECYFQEV